MTLALLLFGILILWIIVGILIGSLVGGVIRNNSNPLDEDNINY